MIDITGTDEVEVQIYESASGIVLQVHVSPEGRIGEANEGTGYLGHAEVTVLRVCRVAKLTVNDTREVT